MTTKCKNIYADILDVMGSGKWAIASVCAYMEKRGYRQRYVLNTLWHLVTIGGIDVYLGWRMHIVKPLVKEFME